MKASLAVFAAAALLPAMCDGALAAAGARTITLSLCSGASLVINSDGSPTSPARGATPCCAKGCRSDGRKRRFDAGQ